MTQPASASHIEYIGTGGSTPFVYPFKIAEAADLEVRLNGAVQTDGFHYDITGVGVDTGGTVTFRINPLSGTVISLRMATVNEQLLHLTPNSPLPAASLEGQLDEIVRMIQNLDETLSRVPQLEVGVAASLRDKRYPVPVPLKLWGWDALGTDIDYYDPTIRQVTTSSTSHLVYGETEIVVPTVNGAVQLTASGVFPAGSIRIGALVRVTTTFGDAGGLTTLSVGNSDFNDKWGAGLSRTATVAPTGANTPGNYRAYEWGPMSAAGDVVITADAGTFDTVGSLTVIGTWVTLVAV